MKKDENVGEADTVAEGRAVVESTSPVVKATVSEVGEVTETLIDKAPVLVDTAQSLEEPPIVAEEKAAEVLEEAKTSKKTKDQSQVSTSSLSDLKDAIESLGMARTEEESLKEIKEELEDYDEDVKELDEIKNTFRHASRVWLLLTSTPATYGVMNPAKFPIIFVIPIKVPA